jgi:hypothetical protein
VFMSNYGLSVYDAGFVLHREGWRLVPDDEVGDRVPDRGAVIRGDRAAVKALTRASWRRLEFIMANVAVAFRTIATLTYHAEKEEWESDPDRNRRIVKRSKRDLNRLLTCLRGELGHYLWVQEFQARGVIHYHLAFEGDVAESRMALAWCRSTGAIGDEAALRHAVKVEAIRTERGVRSYLGRYVGKGRQKELPAGVEHAGRWWGRSKGQTLTLRLELVTREREGTSHHALEVRVLRSVRRWLRGELGFRVSGGTFTDWGGRLSGRLVEVAIKLQEFYAPDWAEEVGGSWSFVDDGGKEARREAA